MDMPNVEWKRPQEIAPDGEPKMYRDSMSPGDIKQGVLGDCWFLGSLLVQSTNPELLNNLIVHDGIQYGFAVFQFFNFNTHLLLLNPITFLILINFFSIT